MTASRHYRGGAAKIPKVLLVLPLAAQDGIDKHAGIVRFLHEHDVKWDIRLDRMSKSRDNKKCYLLSEFDGVIADDPPSPRLSVAFSRLKAPLVAIDWRDLSVLRIKRKCVCVGSDSQPIGRLAAKAILDSFRYSSYAYLPVIGTADWSDMRGEAFARELAKHRIQVHTLNPSASLVQQIRKLPMPIALFAANDVTAEEFLRQSSAAGILVPQDVSVIGVDNELRTCLYTHPPLASIQPDFEQAGYLSAMSLHAMLNGKSVRRRIKYPTKGIVRRTSLGAPGTSGRLVQRVNELIKNTPVGEFGSITSMANQLGISRRLLDRAYRQIEGRSVLDAVHERRLEEVCRLLTQSELSVLDICESCFPGSGTYPLRLFKRCFGMTMKDYRAKKV